MSYSPQSLNEVALIGAIASQDRAALSALYARYARMIYAIAYRLVGSAEEAEEVVLDVFAQVWRIAKSYDRTKSRVDTWLFMLARSRALDKLRSRARAAKVIAASEDALLSHPPVADPEENVLIGERRDQVKAALAQLPPEQRLAIELAYYKGMTHTQIAVETQTSLGTIKTRIRLGLKKMREYLGKEWCS